VDLSSSQDHTSSPIHNVPPQPFEVNWYPTDDIADAKRWIVNDLAVTAGGVFRVMSLPPNIQRDMGVFGSPEPILIEALNITPTRPSWVIWSTSSYIPLYGARSIHLRPDHNCDASPSNPFQSTPASRSTSSATFPTSSPLYPRHQNATAGPSRRTQSSASILRAPFPPTYVCELAAGMAVFNQLWETRVDDLNMALIFDIAFPHREFHAPLFESVRDLWDEMPDELKDKYIAAGTSEQGLWETMSRLYLRWRSNTEPIDLTLIPDTPAKRRSARIRNRTADRHGND